MVILNYCYAETPNKETIPAGDGWEFWGMRNTPDESVAVWRRDADIYGESEEQE